MDSTSKQDFQEDRRKLKEDWQRSRDKEPGERFQHLHRMRRDEESSRPSWIRILYLTTGFVLLALGVLFTFVPGPNWFFAVPGAILLATESGVMARVLDAAERMITPVTRRLKPLWKKANPLTKGLILVFFLGLALLCAYLIFFRK